MSRSEEFAGFIGWIHVASIWTWTWSTTTGHGRGQLCHSTLMNPPLVIFRVLGFSVLHCPTSSDRKASYWLRFLPGHHEWHWSSPSHDRPPSEATLVTPAPVTAPRTCLLRSYTPAYTSGDPLQSDEFIYMALWWDDRRSIWQPAWHLLRLPILLQQREALVLHLS